MKKTTDPGNRKVGKPTSPSSPSSRWRISSTSSSRSTIDNPKAGPLETPKQLTSKEKSLTRAGGTDAADGRPGGAAPTVVPASRDLDGIGVDGQDRHLDGGDHGADLDEPPATSLSPARKPPDPEKSKKHEHDVARILGGTRQPASGALDEKGDVHAEPFLVECKYTARRQYPLLLSTLETISSQARGKDLTPALALRFTSIQPGEDRDWALVPLRVLAVLLNNKN